MRPSLWLFLPFLVSGCFGNPSSNAPTPSEPADAMRVGDWWSLMVHDEVADETFEMTLVVARLAPLSFAMNPGSERALLLPAPPRGIVEPSTLGFQFLGELFQPAAPRAKSSASR